MVPAFEGHLLMKQRLNTSASNLSTLNNISEDHLFEGRHVMMTPRALSKQGSPYVMQVTTHFHLHEEFPNAKKAFLDRNFNEYSF